MTTKFLAGTNHQYPPHNKIIFEEFFYNYVTKNNIETNRIILPIFWTNYYISKNYGTLNMQDLQEFISSLDKTKKYYTIVQWDDCILQELGDIDIKIFCQGGYGRYQEKCYPIPLNCCTLMNLSINQKDIFCSFMGVINGRHRIREKLKSVLSCNKEYFISDSTQYNSFSDIMNRSIFSLCPRGYGQTSFRICEALQRQSIPVYVYDIPLIPFNDIINFNDYGILIEENQIENIDSILTSISEEKIKMLVDNGKEVYKKYYDFEGCAKRIVEIINNFN